MSPCAAGGTRAARSSPTVTLAFPHRCVNVRKGDFRAAAQRGTELRARLTTRGGGPRPGGSCRLREATAGRFCP